MRPGPRPLLRRHPQYRFHSHCHLRFHCRCLLATTSALAEGCYRCRFRCRCCQPGLPASSSLSAKGRSPVVGHHPHLRCCPRRLDRNCPSSYCRDPCRVPGREVVVCEGGCCWSWGWSSDDGERSCEEGDKGADGGETHDDGIDDEEMGDCSLERIGGEWRDGMCFQTVNRRYSKCAVGMERIENMNLQWRYIAKVL